MDRRFELAGLDRVSGRCSTIAASRQYSSDYRGFEQGLWALFELLDVQEGPKDSCVGHGGAMHLRDIPIDQICPDTLTAFDLRVPEVFADG